MAKAPPKVADGRDARAMIKELRAFHPLTSPKALMPFSKSTAASLASRARRWLHEECFPFWAERGPDPRGGFRERLSLAGAGVADEESRVRVQARQTYVFAHAAILGWEPERAKTLVRGGVETMLVACRRPDHLFGRTMRHGGGLVDPQPELYDNAFCLMALAWAARALDEPHLLEEADRTLAAIDAQLAHAQGGYCESLPHRRPRRQNPHMHLFEASIALHQAAPGAGYLARADEILELLERRFVDRSGALREYFNENWTPAPGDEGAVIEPGHMFEWTWLLGEYAKAKGTETPDIAHRLYDAAMPFVDRRGLAPQSVLLGGGGVDGSRRSWPQTEAIKAHLARYESGEAAGLDRAARCLESFFQDYLAGVPAGGWRDHFDEAGRPIAADMPASTGYHVVLALAEFVRVVG